MVVSSHLIHLFVCCPGLLCAPSLCTTRLYSALFCAALPCPALLFSAPLCTTRQSSTPPCSLLSRSTPLHSTLLDSAFPPFLLPLSHIWLVRPPLSTSSSSFLLFLSSSGFDSAQSFELVFIEQKTPNSAAFHTRSVRRSVAETVWRRHRLSPRTFLPAR